MEVSGTETVVDMQEILTPRDRAEGIFGYAEALANAYRVPRFVGSPGMENSPEESIAEHMWATRNMAMAVFDTYPELRAAIDEQHVQDLMLMHDMGEIYKLDGSVANEDISRHIQATEGVTDKVELERLALEYAIENLPDAGQERMRYLFDTFEAEPEVKTVDAAFAGVIDHFHGDMRYFRHAERTPGEKNSVVSVVVAKYTRPDVRMVEQVLAQRWAKSGDQSDLDAYQAFIDFVDGYCQRSTELGYAMDLDFFFANEETEE